MVTDIGPASSTNPAVVSSTASVTWRDERRWCRPRFSALPLRAKTVQRATSRQSDWHAGTLDFIETECIVPPRDGETDGPDRGQARLTKTFGTQRVVDDLSFELAPAGNVTGFLGPEAAAKTTPLAPPGRPCRGRPQASHSSTGQPYRELDPLAAVGAVPEADRLPPLDGIAATTCAAAQAAGLPVDSDSIRSSNSSALAGAADRRVGGYSLGMRQRLGLATPCSATPTYLVLDDRSTASTPRRAAWISTTATAVGRAGTNGARLKPPPSPRSPKSPIRVDDSIRCRP